MFYDDDSTQTDYRVHRFPGGKAVSDMQRDMIPYELLLWAEFPSQYQYLKNIGSFEVVTGKAISGSQEWDIKDIVGLRPTKTHKYGTAPHVGTGGPVPSQAAEWHAPHQRSVVSLNPSSLTFWKKYKAFDETNMSYFDVDGPGGEIITEVHMSTDRRSYKLVTSRGRECYWGGESRGAYHTITAPEGEIIIGLTTWFGQLGGWSLAAKLHSHWRLGEVGVVTMVDDRVLNVAEGAA